MEKDLILNKVARFIDRERLLKPGAHYIVALSGGADSIALALMMKEMGVDVSAAHCNFRLRGEESDRDEQFCVDFCEREDIHLHRIHFDTLAYVEMHKQSIEMAARELRYSYFAHLAKDTGAEGILVAHHRDDNVETLLLNLLRGSGVDGLAAIAPKNGNIIRPLLCISRDEILQYLQAMHQPYVTDSTNLEDDALRNRIRHHVIPLLESINPAARENIALSAKYLRQAARVLGNLPEEKMVDRDNHVVYISKKSIADSASPQYMLHRSIGMFGFHGNVIEEILESFHHVGKVWKSTRYLLVIDREQLLVTPQDVVESIRSEREYKLPEEGKYSVGASHMQQAVDNLPQGYVPMQQADGNDAPVETYVRIRRFPRTADFQPSKAPRRITLDASKVCFPLTYRLTQEGDRFTPFGMRGSKLVSDYLTDRKRNYLEKASQHVVTDSQGDIIWLVGERTSEASKITDQTQEILEISIE